MRKQVVELMVKSKDATAELKKFFADRTRGQAGVMISFQPFVISEEVEVEIVSCGNKVRLSHADALFIYNAMSEVGFEAEPVIEDPDFDMADAIVPIVPKAISLDDIGVVTHTTDNYDELVKMLDDDGFHWSDGTSLTSHQPSTIDFRDCVIVANGSSCRHFSYDLANNDGNDSIVKEIITLDELKKRFGREVTP